MGKRLQIDYIDISRAEFSDKTELDGSILRINKEELLAQADCSLFESVELYLVSPGEEVRILGVTDCTQPRVKADAPDETFPGFYGKLAPAGSGRTVALRGLLITELYPLKAPRKSLLDMKGPIADMSILARHIHLVLDLKPKEGVSAERYSQAQKMAALTFAVYLAKLGIGRRPDESKVYELKPVKENGKRLPRVAYLTSQWAGFDVQQFFYYGQSGMGALPFVVHPNDILDGAFMYRYQQYCYFFQEEAMIKELYRRHGTDIDFAGVIVTSGKTEIKAKDTSSMIAADLARNVLNADITINTKAGMGHCQLEQQMMHIWSEQLGMKAVSVMPAVSNEKPGDLLVISDPRVDAVVHSGGIKTMEYPYMEKLIGTPDIPALAGYDLHGPFTITTNETVAGVNTTQGGNYVTDDLDLKTSGWRRE